jgi:hypothetical protein
MHDDFEPYCGSMKEDNFEHYRSCLEKIPHIASCVHTSEPIFILREQMCSRVLDIP